MEPVAWEPSARFSTIDLTVSTTQKTEATTAIGAPESRFPWHPESDYIEPSDPGATTARLGTRVSGSL